MDYHLHLFDEQGNRVRSLDFSEADHGSMTAIVMALHATCSDTYEMCQVWRGEDCVFVSSHARMQQWALLIEKMQKDLQIRLLAMEETMASSEAAVSQSGSLLHATMALRTRLLA